MNCKSFLFTGLVRGMLCVICLIGMSPSRSLGQIYLTGLLQDGTGANGDTAGSPIWNTLGNELSFANIYLTQPNAGYTAPLINSGNGAGTSISYALSPGSYQFYFFCDALADNDPGNYGLNLFFDGNNNSSPGIAAYSASGMISANAVPAGLSTLPLSVNYNDPNPAPGTYIYTATTVPAPGTLTYTADGLSVTLTSYGFGPPGVFGGPALDRVGNLDSQPDGALDGVGVFTLVVTPTPEPSTSAIAFFSVMVVAITRLVAKRVKCSVTPW
jgi:hypothetical protein